MPIFHKVSKSDAVQGPNASQRNESAHSATGWAQSEQTGWPTSENSASRTGFAHSGVRFTHNEQIRCERSCPILRSAYLATPNTMDPLILRRAGRKVSKSDEVQGRISLSTMDPLILMPIFHKVSKSDAVQGPNAIQRNESAHYAAGWAQSEQNTRVPAGCWNR